jgi:hypothetical protein
MLFYLLLHHFHFKSVLTSHSHSIFSKITLCLGVLLIYIVETVSVFFQHPFYPVLYSILPMFIYFVGFEVLRATVMRSSIFWDIRPCSPLKVNQSSRSCHLVSRWFLACLILRTWRWRRNVPPKRRLTFDGLHGVISQKIELFIYIIL